MNLLKKNESIKTFLSMFLIVVLGAFLRLLFIEKAEGLWNDEYVSYSIASIPLGKKFLEAVFAQCHMPFYYLYLKFFMHFFGHSDLLLRLTSLFAGILSIFSMYFLGKELKDKNLGILCAAITAFSSFLIYYSQEVRIYEILFLFSSLSTMSTIKLGKQRIISNFILFVISNSLILLTHTIGFVFVLFNLIFISFWITKEDKKYLKPVKFIWLALLISFLTLTPLIIKIFTTKSFSQWWGHFTVSKIGFLFTDYFSPILTNLVNAPDNFFYNFSLNFLIFAILPAVIAISGIIKALMSKKYEILGLFFVSLATLAVLGIASISGKLVFITKYSMETYPILILLMAYGLLEIKKKALRKSLIFMFCFLNLYFVFTNPYSAPKMHRSEGHKIVADLINSAHLKKNDLILLTYYPKEKFEKYFDFKNYKVVSINKSNFPEYLGDWSYQEVYKNGKIFYKQIFETSQNTVLKKKIKSEIFDNLEPNQKVVVVFLNTVSMYSPIQIKQIAASETDYKNSPLLFLVFSSIKNGIIEEFLKEFKIEKIESKGSWSAVTFHKT